MLFESEFCDVDVWIEFVTCGSGLCQLTCGSGLCRADVRIGPVSTSAFVASMLTCGSGLCRVDRNLIMLMCESELCDATVWIGHLSPLRGSGLC